jgi:pSer/pThr/pTyr-binding forkhead associated (FHA) protein
MAAPYAPKAAAARAAAAAPPPRPDKASAPQTAPPPRAEKASAPHEYQPPVWSAVPQVSSTPFSFEVIKDGVVVSTMDLSERPYYILGRHKSTAHLVLEHPSISRQHVIVQHRDSGEVYLYDPGSTHGTFCNKVRIPTREHVICAVGSTLKLGQSTRLLCLLGPTSENLTSEEREREAKRSAALASQRMTARAEELAKRTGKSLIKGEDLHARDGGGAGWGFADDAEEQQAEEAKFADGSAPGAMSFEQLYAQARRTHAHEP